jgi:hypothetical protein
MSNDIEQKAHEWYITQNQTERARLLYVVECAFAVHCPPREERLYGDELPQEVYLQRMLEAIEHLLKVTDRFSVVELLRMFRNYPSAATILEQYK